MEHTTAHDLHPSGLRNDHLWSIAPEDLADMGLTPFFGDPVSSWLGERDHSLAAVIPLHRGRSSIRHRFTAALARGFDHLLVSFEAFPDIHDL